MIVNLSELLLLEILDSIAAAAQLERLFFGAKVVGLHGSKSVGMKRRGFSPP